MCEFRSSVRVWIVASSLAGLWLLAPVFPAAPGGLSFRHRIIDQGFYGDCKAIGDVDGDGAVDLVVAGGKPVSRLVWYRAPGWSNTVLDTRDQEFTTDMQVVDIDRDGDLDVVVPLGEAGELLWYENPRPKAPPSTAPWPKHPIGRQESFVHDVECGDLNGDRRPDVVTRTKDGATAVWLQQTPGAWTKATLSTAESGEGTAVADLNRDGRPDIVQNGYWLECPGDPARGTWAKHGFVPRWPALARVAVGDVNGDERPDVVLAPSESAGRLSWCEAPPDPRAGPWNEHVIRAEVSFVHGLQLVDVDRDGRRDVVFAEMAQSPTKRVGFFLNRSRGERWDLQVVADSGSHNIRAGWIGRPAAFCIAGCNWQGPPVELWCADPAPPPSP